MCLCHSGRVSVSHTGDSEFEYSNLFKMILFLSLNLANSVKTFTENSITFLDGNLFIVEPGLYLRTFTMKPIQLQLTKPLFQTPSPSTRY